MTGTSDTTISRNHEPSLAAETGDRPAARFELGRTQAMDEALAQMTPANSVSPVLRIRLAFEED